MSGQRPGSRCGSGRMVRSGAAASGAATDAGAGQASLIARWSGREHRDRNEADDRGICGAPLGRCCASPQVIVKEPVQSRPHGGEITPATGSEPPTPDQRINFHLAQLDPDAAQPFLTPVPVAAHPLGTGRARPGWRSRERRVGHDVPILHRRRGKKEPRRDGGQQPEPGKSAGRARR